MRDRLVREIAAIEDVERAAHWAHAALAAKNTLISSDARLVQVAFALRLSVLEGIDQPQHENASQSALAATVEAGTTEPSRQSSPTQEPSSLDAEHVVHHSGRASFGGIDKSVLTISEVRRYRDRAHIKFVASRACLVCGRKPCDPHHLRFAQVTALGRKVSDEFTVPLCRTHHRELHRTGNEAGWWAKLGIDAVGIAQKLWRSTRSLSGGASSVDIQPRSAEPIQAARSGRRTRKSTQPNSGEAAPYRA